ncbi:MAG: PAS domain S-box protein [Fidelibacterota bacterium]
MNQFFNKIIKGASLRKLLSVGGGIFTLILIFTFGYTSYRVGRDTLIYSVLDTFTKDSQLAQTQIQGFLSHQYQALKVIEKTPPIPAIFRAIQNGGVDPASQDDLTTWRRRLEQIMISTIDADLDHSLQQLRLLDRHGRELVRVHATEKSPKGVPEDDLQDKSGRSYFQKTIQLAPNEYFVSPINLNREYGKIMEPIQPTIRVSIPLFNDEEELEGVLVSNINPKSIFNQLILHEKIFESVFLVNQDGYFLIHPDPDKTFGFDRGFEYTLKNEHPDLAKILNVNDEYINPSSFHGHKLSHFDGFIHIHYNPSDPDKFWAFVFEIPTETVLGSINQLRFNLIILAVFFVVIFSFISYQVSSRLITKPVKSLCGATQSVASGHYQPEDIPSGGHVLEFEQLSSSIKNMIDEIQQSQKALKESEEKFRVLYEMAGDTIIIAKPPEGNITDTNEAASRLLGYSQEEFKHMTGFDIIAPDYIERTDKIWQKQMEEKGHFLLETQWIRKDGHQIPVAVAGTPVTIQAINYIQLIARDISDRKKAEKEIQRLANFPRENPQPVLEINHNGELTYINPAGKQLLKDLGNGSLDKILPLNFRQGVIESFTSGKMLTNQAIVLGERTFLWSAHFIPDLGLVHLYANDISDLKKTELDLIQAKNKAEQADRVKTLFLANMSHEIRTPLNSILGYTELIELETSTLLGEEYLSFFHIVKSSGQRLMNTVHKILDISQVEAGTYELALKPIDIQNLISTLIDAIKLTASNKHLDIHWNHLSKPAMVIVDESSISQAVTNLLDNAIKYTNEGEIEVTLSEQNNQFQLVIRDTGIGISPEYLEHMYDIFSQESSGYTKKYQGIGLGLALAKRFLDLNKVRIDVVSKKGSGTTFTLLFTKASTKIQDMG